MRLEKNRDLKLIARKILFLGLPVLVLAMTASASNIPTTYVTPSGSTTGGGPVSASASFTFGPSFLSITLTDLEANPNNVGQLISGLSFTLSNGLTSGTLFQGIGKQVTVNSDGTFSLAALSGASGWGLNNNVSGGLQLDALGFVGPAGLIIGAPGAGGTYSNANASIAGNTPHNPFLAQTVTFSIVFAPTANVTDATTVTSATFYFGTTPGQFHVQGCMSTDPSCGLAPTPEPISLALTGSGLIGLFFLRRRRA